MYAIDVYKHTPSEIQAMLRGAIERNHDEMEREANIAIMYANAINAQKRIKASNLYRRPTEFQESKRTVEDLRREEQETMKWLSQFKEFNGKIKIREEETNG